LIKEEKERKKERKKEKDRERKGRKDIYEKVV
jgi:hypothetical protein